MHGTAPQGYNAHILEMRTRNIKAAASFSGEKRIVRHTRRHRLPTHNLNKMRRVSSRPRLVSWDAFDASPKVSSLKIETLYEATPAPFGVVVSDNDDSSNETIGARTRKRNRVERSLKNKSAFQSICNDVQLHVASFLDVSDARSLMMADKHHYELVKNATFLWKQWCHQLWPHLPHNSQFVDDTSPSNVPNYSQLLNLASTRQPTHVDTTTFTPHRTAVFRRLQTPNQIQYVGAVGMGDRCIRANAPLVRPVEKAKKHNIFKFLLSRHQGPPKPFVSPFTAKDNKIVLTPRYVSYFEVSILSDGPDVVPQQTPAPNVSVSDCVAVGLSTEGFRCFSRMPGWDAFSYGYHGDDGGIFHASGDMLKRFGPPYGKGDTVGCGVDYLNGGIFYTLNGKMLGYGWTGLEVSQKELYPTIGVDSNAPVDCNFGERSFVFDLCLFLKLHHTNYPTKAARC
jgi:SPRY domain